MINSILEKILGQLITFKSFQDYIDSRVILSYEKYKVHSNCGYKFLNNNNNNSISQIYRDYNFSDIQPSDIVLDIGANIGAFSIFVSKFTKHVYAVEPMTTDILRKNIQLNNIKNITVIESALGDTNKVSWDGKTKNIKTQSLTSLIELCNNKVDFLKLDCEGGEWCITPDELQGIRRIEMEVHNLNNTRLVIDFLKILDAAGFKYTYEVNTEMIVHAVRK